MTPNMQHSKNMDYNVQDRFDEILGRHLERLIGTSYGIGGLPINSAIISCLMLLMERENEIDSFPSDPNKRYTQETLIKKLTEMGFDSDHDIRAFAQDMIRNGYVYAEDDGSLVPEKSAVSTTQLLDRVFPKMPGMNLIAYFIQTVDEVKSERKDLDTALNQFDQILHQHGVSLKKGPLQPKIEPASSTSHEQKSRSEKSDISLKNEQQGPQKEPLKRQDIPVSLRTEVRPDTPVSSSGPRILSSNSYKGKVPIREVRFGKPFSKEDEPEEITTDPDRKKEFAGPPVECEASSEALTAVYSKSASDEQDLHGTDSITAAVENPLRVPESKAQETDLFAGTEEKKEEFAKAEQKMEPEKEVFDKTDDDIEKRIENFEENLAMECPMCRSSKIKIQKTSMGKEYYRCSNKACIFISWGKPYHILCPKCSNPFLVEASGKAGKTILKCPRATCHYRQESPSPWTAIDGPKVEIDSSSQQTQKVAKPRRKVVKRRRVRRKK